MKTMLRYSSLVQSVFISILIIGVCAGCQPFRDLRVFIENKTGRPIQVCFSPQIEDCNLLDINGIDSGSAATGGEQEEWFQEMLNNYEIRLCEKTVPIKSVMLPPERERSLDLYGWVFRYTVTIPQEAYERVCSAEEAAQ